MQSFICADLLQVFGLDWVSMLFYLGNFLLLIGVLVAVLYKPVKKMLKKKREDLDSVYTENEKLKSECQTMKSEYDGKVEELKLESARAAAELASSAQEKADEVIKQAQAQADAIIDAAKKEAATEREHLKTEYRDSVNTLAVGIAEKLLEREIDSKDNSELIEQALSDWEGPDK